LGPKNLAINIKNINLLNKVTLLRRIDKILYLIKAKTPMNYLSYILVNSSLFSNDQKYLLDLPEKSKEPFPSFCSQRDGHNHNEKGASVERFKASISASTTTRIYPPSL
jgi:hypothetical protein